MYRYDLDGANHIDYFPETGNLYLTLHGFPSDLFDLLRERDLSELTDDDNYTHLRLIGGKIELGLFKEKTDEQNS